MIAVILAAGKGTRMKSKLPKALHPICGKPMTRYVIDACKDSNVDNVIVVIGHEAELVREGLGNDVRYVTQEEQLGTGDACRQAIEAISDMDGDVLVLPGDTPLISADILQNLIQSHVSSGADATLLTTILPDGGNYGRVLRSADGLVSAIVEAKDATDEQLRIREINAGIYCFKLDLLRTYLSRIKPENAQGEYYLTDVVGLLAQNGHHIEAVVCDDPHVVEGVNDRVQLAKLAAIVRQRILERLMLEGVTIIDPSATYIDADVQIGRDTVIYPQCLIEKHSTIGEGCIIGPCTRLVNVKLGNGVTVLYSNIVDSSVGDGTRIGPFANIRPGCLIGRNVKIGDFVEAKNAEIGDHVSMSHLAYVGDSFVGEHTNIGAGTITCNYDGYAKHRTVIGKNCFVGSNVTLIAPVEVGDGALIAAGSVITDNVPSDALGIARCKQTIKDGWAKRRRELMERRKDNA
jgi:bifunctional UDP-N-acetylglucosamine pyrophosphorylase/glucosamine-1-phosphate N-acetyltransferase